MIEVILTLMLPILAAVFVISFFGTITAVILKAILAPKDHTHSRRDR